MPKKSGDGTTRASKYKMKRIKKKELVKKQKVEASAHHPGLFGVSGGPVRCSLYCMCVVVLPLLGNLICKWIVWIWRAQQCLDG